jgi:hypothetical protein
MGMCYDAPTHTLFIADSLHHAIRALHVPSRRVITVCGGGDGRGWSDGSRRSARLDTPTGVSVLRHSAAPGKALLIVREAGSRRLRRVEVEDEFIAVAFAAAATATATATSHSNPNSESTSAPTSAAAAAAAAAAASGEQKQTDAVRAHRLQVTTLCGSSPYPLSATASASSPPPSASASASTSASTSTSTSASASAAASGVSALPVDGHPLHEATLGSGLSAALAVDPLSGVLYFGDADGSVLRRVGLYHSDKHGAGGGGAKAACAVCSLGSDGCCIA